MDKDWLASGLASGRSIESIAREVGKDHSTVSYWVRKHGLRSSRTERHAARGALNRTVLEEHIAAGASTREIAEALDRSQATVRHWLKRYGLSTRRRREFVDGNVTLRDCATHGRVEFVRYSATDSFRCRQCRYDAVTRRRRRVKLQLVEEFGGVCQLCGYDRFPGALQFHHRDRSTKDFGIALNGSARSIDRAREEAMKCVLLCANCHAEVEWGDATLPSASGPPPR